MSNAGALSSLAGVYALTPQFRLALRVREGQLYAQATRQPEFEFFAIDTRRYFARVAALELHFEGDTGAPPALWLL